MHNQQKRVIVQDTLNRQAEMTMEFSEIEEMLNISVAEMFLVFHL